jgi:monooxygenase
VRPGDACYQGAGRGGASIVTGTIETFTETGIKVSSGEEIGADITATGFNMSLFGDIAFAVDGEPVDVTDRVSWRGIMISGVPDMAYVFGYLRYSWTLRADMVCDLVAGLLRHMEDKHATPSLRPAGGEMERRPFCDRRTSAPAASCDRRTSCSSRAAGQRGAVDAHAGVPPGTGDPAERRP